MMSNWADLPDDLLHLILSNVFAARDRLSFSLVCRSWNAFINNLSYHHSPGLILYKRSDFPWKLFQHNGFCSMKSPKVVQGAHIRCAKYGWLLLARDDMSLFFLNPFNQQYHTIHHLPRDNFPYTTICFFSKPTSPNCILVGMANTAPDMSRYVQIGVLNHGDDSWKSYTCYSENGHDLSICSPILHHGFLYCLDRRGNLYMNELGNQWSWSIVNTNRPLPPENYMTPPPYEFDEQYLIKVEEEQAVLLAVLVTYDERKVNVYKVDVTESSKRKKWIRVEDLSDKALFVSYNASFALTAPRPPLEWMANKIFFPKLLHKLGHYNGVFYSLQTKKYHSYEGNYCSQLPYGLKGINSATWIMPEK